MVRRRLTGYSARNRLALAGFFFHQIPRFLRCLYCPSTTGKRILVTAAQASRPPRITSCCYKTSSAIVSARGMVWKLKELEIENQQGIVVACRQSPADTSAGADEKMTFDAATRVWRGRECLCIKDLIEEGIWPADGKQSLDGKQVWLGVTWKPTPSSIFTRFHISDIWIDESGCSTSC